METVVKPSTLARIVPDDTGFTVERIAMPAIGSGEVIGEEQVDDSVYKQIGSGVTRNNERLLVTTELPYDGTIHFESRHPSIATVDSSGVVVSVANGDADIIVTVDAAKMRVRHSSVVVAGSSLLKWDRYADGTLGKAINQSISAVRTISNAKNVFTSSNHETGVYVRNPNLWASVNLSGWPVRNVTQNTSRYLGCLVTRKHLIQAWHARSAKGSILRFVSPSNEVVERKIVDSVRVAQTDLALVTLEDDVPEGIAAYRVFPPNFTEKIKVVNLPIIAGDQSLQVVARIAHHIAMKSSEDDSLGGHIAHTLASDWSYGPTYPELVPVTETIISGDSGSPLWVILHGELIAIGTHTTSLSCASIGHSIEAINEILQSEPGLHAISAVDTSSWQSY